MRGAAYIPKDELDKARRYEFILENAPRILAALITAETLTTAHEFYAARAVEWASELYVAIERSREDQ